MPTFEYLCDSCGQIVESLERGDRLRCPNCGASARRRFGFRVASAFREHYNLAVGAHVTNEADFREKLKLAGERQTEITGIEHNYVPVDPHDHEAVGITDDHLAALEPTKKAMHDSGMPA